MAKRRTLRLLCFALLALAAIEGSAYLGCRILASKYLTYRTPVVPPGRESLDYEEYLERRDDLLGWPSPGEFGGDVYDTSGARHSPAYPDATSTSCLSIYGDSFAFGVEVDDESTWSNRLARLLECRVANFAVGGYGTDQAYLRYVSNEDSSPVVILGHLSDDILRHLTRCRDLQTGTLGHAQKPRFVLDHDGQLELVPLPSLSESDYLRLLGLRPGQLELEFEEFYQGGRAGVVLPRFPFVLSLLRSRQDFRMRAKLSGRPRYAEFYERGHLLQGLEITTAVVKAFFRVARERGQRPLFVVFASKRELEHYSRTGEWTHANLLEDLDEAGLPYLDFGEQLADRMNENEIGSFFVQGGSHYDAATNQLLAQTLHDYLLREEYLEALHSR